jgi:hypothetical protein
MFVTAVWEISHTGQVKVRLSSGLIRAIHIGDPQLGQVGRLLGSEFGGVCVMALPILLQVGARERLSVADAYGQCALASDFTYVVFLTSIVQCRKA